MTDQDIVRCADICDDDPSAQVVELMFHDFAKHACFHGEAVTFSAFVTQALMQDYPGIRSGRIVGHEDIARGRKTDPGQGFDWTHFLQQLTKERI